MIKPINPKNLVLLIRLNSLISKLTHLNHNTEALHLFSLHPKPDQYTIASALSACANLQNSVAGKQLHAHATVAGFRPNLNLCNSLLAFYTKCCDPNSSHQVFDEITKPDVYSWTTLLSSYTKCGMVHEACKIFDRMPETNVVSWNAIINGCAEHGHADTSLQFFREMRSSGISPDRYTYASVLSLCSCEEMVNLGMVTHGLVIRSGVLLKVSVVNSLVSMYLGFGLIEEAYWLFEEALVRDDITFNGMISGLVDQGRNVEALMVFKDMQIGPWRPSDLTFVSVLSACSSTKMVTLGDQVYALVTKSGLGSSIPVCNSAITMYSSCQDLQKAYCLFMEMKDKDLVSWNSIITGFSQLNCHLESISLFLQMRRLGVQPDEFTLGTLFAGANFLTPEFAETIQAFASKYGFLPRTTVYNALVSAYMKLGKLEEAQRVFHEIPEKNLISYNAIISGFLQNGLPIEASALFYQLQGSKLKPNSLTLNLFLNICASKSSLAHGKEAHSYILRHGHESETILNNALITMYAKCGALTTSRRVFDEILERDLVTWNAMISGYAQHGHGAEVIACFEAMQNEEVKPDCVTFTLLLTGCSHAGLVQDGLRIFSLMVERYRIEPGLDHYSCVVDLLGRAGRLQEAEKCISSMPFEADSCIWWALLSACRAHGDVRLGEIAASNLMEMEPENPAVYVLLSNIYAGAGRWDEAAEVRGLMTEKGVVKEPGCSWVDERRVDGRETSSEGARVQLA
ncbi:hypothetical protein AMTRI_Chr12g238620 [Amborella trichopoda]